MPRRQEQARIFLRLGSHSEKEYFEKTAARFDGVIAGANLIQSTPGATASLLFKLNVPILINPMTYAFGSYVDPETEAVRDDLDWIKSDQIVKGQGQTKTTSRKVKRSYVSLAKAYGGIFDTCLSRGKAISPADFNDPQVVMASCTSVIEYQRNRLRSEFERDEETKAFAGDFPPPMAFIAPYFYTEDSNWNGWLEANVKLIMASRQVFPDDPIHAVLCFHRDVLSEPRRLDSVLKAYGESGADGVWLWISKFDERSADDDELNALARVINYLSLRMSVYNLHGGYFSLALSRRGLCGIAHGVGYGEQKDIVPVVGQSTPTILYYVKSLRGKFSVPELERSFISLGINSAQDFYDQICGCVICRGIIQKDLTNFRLFGEIHYSHEKSQRRSQTPEAARRCRFHFLLNKIEERKDVSSMTLGTLSEDLRGAELKWRKTILRNKLSYLGKWADCLDSSFDDPIIP